MEVPDFIDDRENLFFHLRGVNLVRITGRGWLRDRVRFSHDGFRRQRLIQPFLDGSPSSWPAALTRWWGLVYNRPLRLEFDFAQVYAGWLRLLLTRLSFPIRSAPVYSVDRNLCCRIYQGSHGLEAARMAEVVLPIGSPYEEFGALTPLAPGFQPFTFSLTQLFLTRPRPAQVLFSRPPFSHASCSSGAAFFQVSPLQRFLAG